MVSKGFPLSFVAIQVRRTWFGTCPLNNMVKETTEKNRYRRYPVGYLGTSIRSRSADKLNRCGAIKGIKRRGYFSLSLSSSICLQFERLDQIKFYKIGSEICIESGEPDREEGRLSYRAHKHRREPAYDRSGDIVAE